MILETLYYVLPGIVANGMPVIVRRWFKFLAVPVDHGCKFGKKSLFGSHKTYRGFISGIVGAMIIAYLQKLMYVNGIITNTYIDYSAISVVWIGIVFGFGALFGDLVESFIKRRLNVKPGARFFPWDQIDYVVGISVFSFLIRPMTIPMVLVLLVSGLIIHVSITRLAFLLKIREKKW